MPADEQKAAKRARIQRTAVLMAALVVILFCVMQQTAKSFTPGRWAALLPEKRYVMVQSLLERQQLTGLTGDEVQALLGAPDVTDSADCYAYAIGAAREDGVPPTLTLTFANGAVVSAEILPDGYLSK